MNVDNCEVIFIFNLSLTNPQFDPLLRFINTIAAVLALLSPTADIQIFVHESVVVYQEFSFG